MMNGATAAALTAGGAFAIAPGRLKAIVSGSVSGRQTSVDATNQNAVTGQYDEKSGIFTLTGGLTLQELSATVQFMFDFGFTNRPPLTNAGPDQTVECTLPSREATVQLSASGSVDPDPGDQIVNYAWTVGRELVAQGPSAVLAVAHLGLGNRLATLTTIDSHGSVSRDTALIDVVDTTPPVLTAPPDVVISSCDAPNIGRAIASDSCGGNVTVTNDAPPKFTVGTTVVTWRAVDQVGNVTSRTQTITVELGDDPSCCPPGMNIIVGTAQGDVIKGTSGSDCILGLGGDDLITGGGGDDIISGGAGNDNIDAGDGNDLVFGGLGQNVIFGGAGNDHIVGGPGSENLSGGADNDRIEGNGGNDVCSGDDGDDTVSGGPGNDVIVGGRGNDKLFGDEGDDNLQGGEGDDLLNGGAGFDRCVGAPGRDVIIACEKTN